MATPHHGGTVEKNRGNYVEWPPGKEDTKVHPEPRSLESKNGFPSWIRGKRFAAKRFDWKTREETISLIIWDLGYGQTHVRVQIYLPRMVQDQTQNSHSLRQAEIMVLGEKVGSCPECLPFAFWSPIFPVLCFVPESIGPDNPGISSPSITHSFPLRRVQKGYTAWLAEIQRRLVPKQKSETCRHGGLYCILG